MGIFEDAISDILDDEDVAITITYTRGADSVELSAVPTKHSENFDDVNDGYAIEQRELQFIVNPVDLILDGVEVIPEKGDVITWDDGTYEVYPSSGLSHGYSRSAPVFNKGTRKTVMRITCKQVS